MKVYIASSWKNQHAVEMLTALLREIDGVEVLSFVENNFGEGHGPTKPTPFEDWLLTPEATQSFLYDTRGATRSDLVIYIGPSGVDAWAEVGAAWASNIPVYGLWAKGEQAGLMRRMVGQWFERYPDLVMAVDDALDRGDIGDAEHRALLTAIEQRHPD